MSRAVWKGPFVDPSLIKKVDKLKDQINKPPIKTWSRKSTIIQVHTDATFSHGICPDCYETQVKPEMEQLLSNKAD